MILLRKNISSSKVLLTILLILESCTLSHTFILTKSSARYYTTKRISSCTKIDIDAIRRLCQNSLEGSYYSSNINVNDHTLSFSKLDQDYDDLNNYDDKEEVEDDDDDDDGDDYDVDEDILLPQEQNQQDASSIHEENTENITLQKGKPEGFYITNHYCVPNTGLDYTSILVNATEARDTDSTDGYAYYGITVDDVDRLNVQMMNVSLPIALMILDPDKYRSLSRARKDCRKGYILIHRGPLVQNNTVDSTIEPFFEQDKLIRGRVGDRIFPGDVIAYQVRMSGGFYPNAGILKPSFDVPVVYEDDHFAIVNKPAGVVVYSHRNGGHGRMTMTSALPWVLRPPKMGTVAIVRKPSPVHRLDKPTSGLLVVAKTKPAMINLSEQFRIRRVRKTYVAIVNGIPNEPAETRITSQEAYEMGVDVDMNILNDDCGEENSFTTNSTEQKSSSWQLVDTMLDDKSAVTIWRPLKYVKSLKAKDGVLTLVELKPKTGRYHQLRRHMAWVKECPLVGDSIYDGGGEAMNLRRRGLFLCSNQVRLDHPYYNTDIGRKEWEALPEHEKWANGKIQLVKDLDGKETIEVLVKIDLPEKFESFLLNEGERYRKLEE